MQKYVAISFTATLTAYLRGDITLKHVGESEFRFSCQREHVLRNDGRVPFEATWANTTKLGIHAGSGGDTSVPLSAVDDRLQACVNAFLLTIRGADAMGLVQWGCGNQYDILKTLAPEQPVIWQGRVTTAGEVTA